ncbi:MAG: cytochrome C oxidase subunit IV family protein [Candidatus Binatia bacterium]
MEHVHSAHATHAHPTVGLYVTIFGALMVLTAVTVGVAFLNLGPLNNVVALGIAGIKTSLVVLFFMHVHYASRTTKIFAAAGFFWLSILIIFTVSDMHVRTPPAAKISTQGWSSFPSTSPIAPPAGVTPHTAGEMQHEGEVQSHQESAQH